MGKGAGGCAERVRIRAGRQVAVHRGAAQTIGDPRLYDAEPLGEQRSEARVRTGGVRQRAGDTPFLRAMECCGGAGKSGMAVILAVLDGSGC